MSFARSLANVEPRDIASPSRRHSAAGLMMGSRPPSRAARMGWGSLDRESFVGRHAAERLHGLARQVPKLIQAARKAGIRRAAVDATHPVRKERHLIGRRDDPL